ncbi:MAG TPA: hypothetical protein VGM80_14030 [Gaiellaceae bacterium]
MSTFTHHPLKTIHNEAHLLREMEQAGNNAATPLIAIGMILQVVVPLGAVMMLLAFGAAWLFG